MFHVDITKVDQDVVYVTIVSEVYYKHLLKMFYLFFRRMFASVFLFGCCICFIYVTRVRSNDFSCFSLMLQ